MKRSLVAVANRGGPLRLAILVLEVGTLFVFAAAPASARAAAVFSVTGARGAGPARYGRACHDRQQAKTARRSAPMVACVVGRKRHR
jgi:hypothetical protein